MDQLFPPAHLCLRQLGTDSREFYLESGETSVENAEAALAKSGRSLVDFRSVLDFGCGVGRATRWLARRAAQGTYVAACDQDAEAITWLRESLPGVDVRLNGGLPPLPFEDGTFDLVIAFSVFSHLDEDYQDAWLAELRRVTSPGAFLLPTVQGQWLWAQSWAAGSLSADPAREEVRARFERDGFAFWNHPPQEGLPAYYRTSFHTPRYVRRHWSRWFEVLDYLEDWAKIEEQDMIIVRRPAG